MKHIIIPALSLFFFFSIATVLLGLVRNITLEPIEQQRRKTLESTMKAVLKEATEFKEAGYISEMERSGSLVRVFEGSKGGELIGFVLELAPVGYSGEINIMVGISKVNNEITGMRVLRHSETPGLGALAVKENFYRKFDGRKLIPLSVVRSLPGENDIEAITSATITSTAITNAVNEAIEWYRIGTK
jgi:electron transport complex protein RnfG